MKTIQSLLWITFLFAHISTAKAQYLWAKAGGGAGVDIGKGVKIDLNGDLIVYGDIAGDPTFQSVLYKGKGLSDGFVAKYGTDGTLKWLKLFGGSLVDKINGADVDEQGNVYVVGNFEDSLSVDGFGIRSAGRKDIFVAKLNTNGQTQWLKKYGGVATENPTALVSDKNGYIYFTGTYTNQINFGNLTVSTSNISEETFVVKLSDSGNPIWAKTAKTQHPNAANGLALMPDGGIAMCGYFSLKFKLDSLEINTSSANYEVFVARLDANGNTLWLSQAGGPYEDIANAIATDALGNIAIAGYSAGVAYFDTFSIGNSGYNDPFIAKYDANGKCLWAKRGAGLDLDIAYGVAFDQLGNVYSTGFFDRAISFEGQSIYGADKDVFMVSYSPTGNLRWVKSAGGNGTDCGLGIAVNNTNEVITSGYYLYQASFDNIVLPLGNAEDVFVTKFAQPQVGIKDMNATNITLYPNPVTNGELILETEKWMIEDGNIKVVLYDNMSRVVLESSSKKIDVSSLESGIYTLTLKTKEYLQTQRVVVSNQ